MPRNFARLLLTLLVLIYYGAASPHVHAQRAAKRTEAAATGVIAGRVTSEGTPLANVTVMLLGMDDFSFDSKPAARTRTDADGGYRLANVAAGRYRVTAYTPVFVAPDDERPGFEGKSVTLDAGETISNVDFALRRGGVITGRVTDGDSQPVIGERVVAMPIDDETGKLRRERFNFRSNNFTTDDRGIYRIYGLAPGKYLVSAGTAGERKSFNLNRGARFFVTTFHPEARDEERATPVEVAAGDVTSDVDIRLKQTARGYAVTGRILDADTGQPMPDVPYGYGKAGPDGTLLARGFTGGRTNSRGEFRIEGLLPDKYAVITASFDNTNSDYYSEPGRFEIVDADAAGVIVKMRRGASVSGTVVLEDAIDSGARERLAQLSIVAFPSQPGGMVSVSTPAAIAASGAFRLTGLRPGVVSLFLNSERRAQGFMIVRVERDGVPLANNELKIAAGDQLTGVRVVVAHGRSVIRGVVNVVNGELPSNAQLFVSLRRADSQNGRGVYGGQADINRRFIVEGVAAGEYEIVVNSFVSRPQGGAPNQRPATARQRISVDGTSTASVTLTLDLTPPPSPEVNN